MSKKKKTSDIEIFETHVEVEDVADNLEIMVDELETNPNFRFVITENGVPKAYLISYKNADKLFT